MLKLENSIRGLSFSRVAFDLTIQAKKNPIYTLHEHSPTSQQKSNTLLILMVIYYHYS